MEMGRMNNYVGHKDVGDGADGWTHEKTSHATPALFMYGNATHMTRDVSKWNSTGAEEFAAHTAAVNCVAIGRRSGRVFATGSDDRRVNVWALGRSSVVLSLQGHQSAVECVAFDAAEEVVIAGASGGTVKLWDLEETKTVRTLTGHRSNCLCLDFHPIGEFFGSGSLDTNVKVWDVRRKGCIHTFKGHAKGVQCIKFSPDGRWVLSGGEDGSLKLWDLTAGKLIKALPSHDAAVSSLCFHPNEYLLATASVDRTVRFWDLETFELAGQAGPEATGIRAATFSPGGEALLAVSSDSLKIWRWEPEVLLDEVHLSGGSGGMPGGGGGTGNWSGAKVADVCFSQSDGGQPRLLTASLHGSFVALHAVDLSKCRPWARGSSAEGSHATGLSAEGCDRNAPGIHGLRRSYEFGGGGAPLGSARGFAAVSAEDSPAPASSSAHRKGQSPLVNVSELRAAVASAAARTEEPSLAARKNAAMISTSTEMSESFQERMHAAAEAVHSSAQHADSLNIIEKVTEKHNSFMIKMQIRQTNLKAIETFWSKGDVKGAVSALAKAGREDVALVYDVLASIEAAFRPEGGGQPGAGMTLEHCGALLPFVDMLISAPSSLPERHLPLALGLTETWLTSFGDLIRSVLIRRASESASSNSERQGAIDFSFEERVDKCILARDGFLTVRMSLEHLAEHNGISKSELSRATRLATAIASQLRGL